MTTIYSMCSIYVFIYLERCNTAAKSEKPSAAAVLVWCQVEIPCDVCPDKYKLTISTQYSVESISTFTLETESCRVAYSFLTQTTCGVILTWWRVIFTYTEMTIIPHISYITYTVIWIWQVYAGAMWTTRVGLAIVDVCNIININMACSPTYIKA